MSNNKNPCVLDLTELNLEEYEIWKPVNCGSCYKSYKSTFVKDHGIGCSGQISKDGFLFCGYGSANDNYNINGSLGVYKRSDVDWDTNNVICDECIDSWLMTGKLYVYGLASFCVCCNKPLTSMYDNRCCYLIDFDSYAEYSPKYFKVKNDKLEEYKSIRNKLDSEGKNNMIWLCNICSNQNFNPTGPIKKELFYSLFPIFYARVITDIIFHYHDRLCTCIELVV